MRSRPPSITVSYPRLTTGSSKRLLQDRSRLEFSDGLMPNAQHL